MPHPQPSSPQSETRRPMENDLFTANQKPDNIGNLSQEIKSALLELRAFSRQKVKALYWNEYYVAIPLEVEVNIPTRGTVDNIDIREREPIYLLLHRQDYPYKVPSVWSNRRDFPKDQLPHLNPKPPGSAANLCLHRGRLDDWFAEHTIVDLVQRVRGWLRDAARDRLIRREDGFEVTRLDEVIGYSIYEPSVIINHIHQKWLLNNGRAGFAFLWYKLLKNPNKEPLVGKDAYAIRLVCPLSSEMIANPLELSQKINAFHTEENKMERMLFGVLAWPSKKCVCKRYFAELPDTLTDFQKWAEGFGIPLKDALQTFLSEGLHLLGGVPVTLVIPRPQNIIGTQSPLELLNFVISAGAEHLPKDGVWDLDAEVKIIGHRAPLTLHRARDLSAQPTELDFGRLLFFGCGAVGSKLILHISRSGQCNMTLVDYDELSPHNLVRHGLLHESLGMNKAQAIKNAIDGMFYADNAVKVDIIKDSALSILLGEQKEILNQYTWLIDTTASSMMLNILSQTDLPETLSCCRCEIADHGRLGFISVEGANRNPRLDDLQVLVFDMAVENPAISRWLQLNQEQREEEVGSILEEINIGISCSSETMRLSDELVSLHTASFAAGFRRMVKDGRFNNAGRIQISRCSEEGSVTTVVQQFDIPPMTVIEARNNPDWQVRLGYGLETKLKKLFRQARPNETGGLLIGIVNFKRRIIYVTRVLPAPPDSESYPYAFIRGIQDIPEKVFKIQDFTGGMLGYVGEWHTHPAGGPELSDQDKEAVKKIRGNLDNIPLPTHVMIVTSRGLYPHIFSSK